MSLTHNPFEKALKNMFVNGRGELSDDLSSSRSKVAEEVRQRRAREEKEKNLQRQVYRLNKENHRARLEIKEARKVAPTNEEQRISLNIFVSEKENVIKGNSGEINRLKGELRKLRRFQK